MTESRRGAGRENRKLLIIQQSIIPRHWKPNSSPRGFPLSESAVPIAICEAFTRHTKRCCHRGGLHFFRVGVATGNNANGATFVPESSTSAFLPRTKSYFRSSLRESSILHPRPTGALWERNATCLARSTIPAMIWLSPSLAKLPKPGTYPAYSISSWRWIVLSARCARVTVKE